MQRLTAVMAFFVLPALALGCGPRMHRVQVVPNVDGATVTFDGEQVGQGETTIEVPRHDRQARPLKVCGPEGWFCTQTTLDASTPETLTVDVPRDNAWHETQRLPNANTWVEVPAGEPAELDATWASMTEAVRAVIPELEVDDPRSYYLRTPWHVAGEAGDESRIRSRLIVALGDSTSVESVALKVRVESERIDPRGIPAGMSDRADPAILEAREAAIAAVGAYEGSAGGSAEESP